MRPDARVGRDPGRRPEERRRPQARVIVVGGGAAGMMAAIAAAETGAPVLLLEKMPRLGRKLLLSGKGRCNLTNRRERDEFIEAFGKTGPFLRNAFHRFFVDELIEFFARRDVPLRVDRGGRLFPESNRAGSVVEAMTRALAETGVIVRMPARVVAIDIAAGEIRGVWVAGAPPGGDGARRSRRAGPDQGYEPAAAVVVCTGGLSYPQTGSTGDGYGFAQAAGHAIEPLRPALVPLITEERFPPIWSSVTLRNVRATLFVDGRETASLPGDMFLLRTGVGGPIILSLSRRVGEALAERRRVELEIDFKPALSREMLDARIQRELDRHGGSGGCRAVLRSLLPLAMNAHFLGLWGVSPACRGSEVTREERQRLGALLQHFRLHVQALRPIEEAIVTAGGVRTDEIDPRTMESRKVAGLYFAGEMLDVDAVTGGFNLQAAFSTGWVAGRAAAARVAAASSADAGPDPDTPGPSATHRAGRGAPGRSRRTDLGSGR
jgi:predicted flavoprotein YhiN